MISGTAMLRRMTQGELRCLFLPVFSVFTFSHLAFMYFGVAFAALARVAYALITRRSQQGGVANSGEGINPLSLLTAVL